jgi:hypothetical protein
MLRTSPFSTLLSNSPWQILCNHRPFLGSIFIHKLQDSIVFLFHPCTLHQIGIQNLLPSMQALHVCSIRKMLRWKVILDKQLRSTCPLLRSILAPTDKYKHSPKKLIRNYSPIFFQFFPLKHCTARRNVSSWMSHANNINVRTNSGRLAEPLSRILHIYCNEPCTWSLTIKFHEVSFGSMFQR